MQRGMCARTLGVGAVAFVVLSGCDGSGRVPVSPTPYSLAPLFPQPISAFMVSGIVSLANSGEVVPLEGVDVEDAQRHVVVKTDKDGTYTIRDVGTGAAYFSFRKDGYRPLSRAFHLVGDTRLDIQLVRE